MGIMSAVIFCAPCSGTKTFTFKRCPGTCPRMIFKLASAFSEIRSPKMRHMPAFIYYGLPGL